MNIVVRASAINMPCDQYCTILHYRPEHKDVLVESNGDPDVVWKVKMDDIIGVEVVDGYTKFFGRYKRTPAPNDLHPDEGREAGIRVPEPTVCLEPAQV